jgi:hypothetical protein
LASTQNSGLVGDVKAREDRKKFSASAGKVSRKEEGSKQVVQAASPDTQVSASVSSDWQAMMLLFWLLFVVI